MKQETKEVLYWCAIIACSFAFFQLGQRIDDKCAAAVTEKRKIIDNNINKAANAKINFCLHNRPSLSNPRQTLDKFRLFKEMHCPQRLLYDDCDQTCREEILDNVRIDLEIDDWSKYNVKDPDDLFELTGIKPEGLPLPDEDFRHEP